jgi:hypothetical protein
MGGSVGRTQVRERVLLEIGSWAYYFLLYIDSVRKNGHSMLASDSLRVLGRASPPFVLADTLPLEVIALLITLLDAAAS